jgi:hypothetical protein
MLFGDQPFDSRGVGRIEVRGGRGNKEEEEILKQS